MHKNATKCNKTQSKWCKNKHGASKIIDTFETYQGAEEIGSQDWQNNNNNCKLSISGIFKLQESKQVNRSK
jgi:hypothetical protein